MKQLTFILTLSTFCIFGQCINCEQKEGLGQICWGEDRPTTELHLAQFMDYSNISSDSKSKVYITETITELNWLLDNVPCLSRCLYFRAEKYLQLIIDHEETKKKKKNYIKKLEKVKRLKTQYFPVDDPTIIPCR